MTSSHLIVQHDAAYLITDTAAYLPDGTITHFTPKVLILTHAIAEPAAIAFTGNLFPQEAAPIIERLNIGSASQLLMRLPEIARAAEDYHRSIGKEPSFCMKVAHWNAQFRRADGHVISNDSIGFHADDGYTPFEVKRVGWMLSFSGDSPWRSRKLTDPVQFDPMAEAGAILDHERQERCCEAAGGHVVGGAGVVTRVTLGSTITTQVRSWQDAVGQKIAA